MGKSASYFSLFLMTVFEMTLHAKEYESPLYTQYTMEIIRSFSQEVKKEFGFECIGSGGSMPNDVEEITIKFAAYQRATIEQARELEVKLTEKLLATIKAHKKITPFLRENPFPFYRTRIGISFYEKNNHPYMDGSVAYVSLVNKKIYYYAENPLNPYVYKDLKNEPYEEALKIVQSSKPDFSR